MGLRYESSESALLITTMKHNVDTVNHLLQDIRLGSKEMMQAIDGNVLSGKAYRGVKEKIGKDIVAVVDAMQRHVLSVQQDLIHYQYADNQVNRYSVLDEDYLKEQIRLKQQMVHTIQKSIFLLDNQIEKILSNELTQDALRFMDNIYTVRHQLNQSSFSFENDLVALEKQLSLLYAFSDQTNQLFNDNKVELERSLQSIAKLNDITIQFGAAYRLENKADRQALSRLHDRQNIKKSHFIYAKKEDELEARLKQWYKKIQKVLKTHPDKLYKMLYDATSLWDLIDELGKTRPDIVDKFLKGMEFLEKIKNKNIAKVLKRGGEYLGKMADPVRYVLKEKMGIEKFLKTSSFKKWIGKGGKWVNNTNLVSTLAPLVIQGMQKGISEGIKEKSLGKGVIAGALETVKNVGPLDGMTIGSSLGSVVPVVGTVAGGVIGGTVGVLNKGMQLIKPSIYDDIKNQAYQLYDGVKKMIGDGISQSVQSIKKMYQGAEDSVKKIGDIFEQLLFPKITFQNNVYAVGYPS